MKVFKTIALLFILTLYSCNSTNKSVSTSTENESKMKSTEMIAEGFLAGEISVSKKEGDCPITIKIQGKNGIYYYDPINLDEEYNKEGEKVWFKFAGLRRMNRCDKASPISIVEIQKRN